MDKQVRHIQQALVAAGLGPGPVDGIWGRRTQAAVMEFQRREGLAVDGIVGPATWAALQEAMPRAGAVMVFWRESRESGLGHVGFYVGEDRSGYFIIGGNQNDSVCYIWMPKNQFLGARWPRTARFLQAQAQPKQMVRGKEFEALAALV